MDSSEPLPFIEHTSSLCPVCRASTPAEIREEAGKIWLTSVCPQHGGNKSLLAGDAAEYKRLRLYTSARMGMPGGCCGAGETCEDGPPVCVLLLEITLACNLQCPTCFADAHGHNFMTIEEIRGRLDAFFKTANRLDLLMLSGGEPTIHSQFLDILALALTYPIGRILINTNGLRVAQSAAIADGIAAHRDRTELFLSFSSFQPAVHERLYGKVLLTEKMAALEQAHARGIFTTLAPVIEKGINDNEIGDLYRFALTMDNINGLNFQPVMSSGRYLHGSEYKPAERMTLTDVLHALEAQTGGALQLSDFVALPCSHPDCCAITYGFLDAKRTVMQPLPRHLDVGRYLDMFSDRISFAGLISSATRRVWSDVTHLRARQTLKDLALLYREGGVKELMPLLGNPEQAGKRIFRIVVKPFMDVHTYDAARTTQCCTKILLEDGQAVSFCEYNVLHRARRQRTVAIPLSVAKQGG